MMLGLKQVALSLLALTVLTVSARSQTTPQLGQIHVTVQPEGSLLLCDGQPANSPPTTLTDLREGAHLLLVSKTGYQDARRTVTLLPGQRVNVEFTLKPITGLVIVHSEPPNAIVEIDGVFYGNTPLLLTDIAPGSYRMKLTANGTRPREVPLVIEDRTPRKVSVELDSDAASLEVASEPAGARLIVNGISKGTTPCTVSRIPEGDATIELTLEGYKPYSQVIKLTAGLTHSMEAVLEPLPAQLTIISRPEGARIYVNNEYRGKAPLTLPDLEPAEYRLRVEKDGCEMMVRTVLLALGQSLTEEFRLSANTGTIELSTEPAGVTVYVDGKELGVTAAKTDETDQISEPFVVADLDEGTHQVQISRKGFKGESFLVKTERNETASFHKKLIKLFIPNCELVTKTAVHKGVFVEESPDGDVKLETHPGVLRTFPAAEIRFRRPLREDE